MGTTDYRENCTQIIGMVTLKNTLKFLCGSSVNSGSLSGCGTCPCHVTPCHKSPAGAKKFKNDPGTYKYILSLADSSGCIKELIATPDCTARHAAQGFRIVAAKTGIWPHTTICADRGPAFKAEILQSLPRSSRRRSRTSVINLNL